MRAHSVHLRGFLTTLFCLAALALAPALRCHARADAKLDETLDLRGSFQPVFVRLDDQLFRGAGEFEAFCHTHDRDRRSDLRRYVTQTLRERADRSWDSIREKLAALEAAGQVKEVTRFWVVNGFACEATGPGCAALADAPGVSFVYKQSGPEQVRQ